MPTMLEVGLVLLVLAALFGAYSVIHAVKPFIVDAAVGLVAIPVAALATLDVAFAPGLLAGPTAV